MTLRITIEIVPFGVEAKKRVIETINVSNITPGHDDPAEYVIEHNDYKHYNETTPRVRHRRDDGALVLARKALEEITK